MKRIFSFRYKLLLSFLLISTLPLIIVSFLILKESNLTLEEREIQSRLDFLRQTGFNIEQMTSNVNEVSLFLLQNQDSYDFLHLPPDVTEEVSDYYSLRIYRTLMFFMNNETGISSIYIEGDNGRSFSINPLSQKLDILNKELRAEIIALDGDALWTTPESLSGDNPGTVVQSRLIKDYRNLDRNLGIVMIQVDTDKFLNNLSMARNDPGEQYFILRRDGQELLSSEPGKKEISDLFLNDLKFSSQPSGFRHISLDRQSVILFYYTLPVSKMVIIWSIPLRQIQVHRVVINQVTTVTLVMILISILLAFLFSRSFFIPLQSLERGMKKVEKEQFEIFIPLTRKDEIGSLLQSFNRMARRLNELHKEVYVAQVKEKEAELIALETQINPHFLYNTLDTIYWTSKLEGSTDAAEMVKALASLFRIVLSSGNEIIPLKKELEHLGYYVEIQKIRFGDRLHFHLSVDQNLEEPQVLKLILQPLVENAIIHGLEKTNGILHIKVEVFINSRNELVYSVKDDGPGFVSEVQEQTKRGFGLSNVDERLKLAYGETYGIQINSIPDEGAEVIVRQNPIDLRDIK